MVVCAACGRSLAKGQSSCACGARRSTRADSARATPRLQARQSTVQPSPEARKQATILFCDVCGSTAKIAEFDVEQARDFLAPATQLMRDAVEAYGGMVYRVDGDGVLALFGAPLGQEDQAVRACLAAIDILRRAADDRSGAPTLVVRVGINSGEVIVWQDAVSRTDRVDGKSVHFAKRLQEFASPGTVVLSGSTHRLAGEDIDAHSLGLHELRDIGRIELFELSTQMQRSPVDPLARRRQLGPLVGREQTMAALDAISEPVRSGCLRIVGLRGEAGVGKSRVLLEYAKRLRADGFQDCWVSARAYATQTPFAVVADLIRAMMGLPEADAARQRDAALAIVTNWPEPQRRYWVAAAELLEIAGRDMTAQELTPGQRQRYVTETLYWLVAERAAAAPVLIVIDDIFLADRESQRLLGSLARRMNALPVLMCMTYRQDFVHRWSDLSSFTEHRIAPLPADEVAQHARALLGTDPSLVPVLDSLVERADGNPFFLEQMAMTLVDDGTLVGAPGGYRCAHDQVEVRLPASIAAVIGARLDRLPTSAKAALEAAAIVGWPISGAVIGAMQQADAVETGHALRAAQSSGLLTETDSLGETERYEFRHGLVQDAVLATLTRPRRKALHRAAVRALRAHFDDQIAEHAPALAQHAYDGEAWIDAAAFAQLAMTRSIAHSAYRDALRLFALGLDAAQRLDEPAASRASELSLRMHALGAQLPLGQLHDIVTNLERAETITRELGDVRRQANVQFQLAVMLWTRGSYRQGLQTADMAVNTAADAGNAWVRMAAMQARMLHYHGLGQYERVAATAREIEHDFAAELSAGQILPGWAVIPGVNTKAFLADSLWRMSRFEEAQHACDEAYRELARHEHTFSRVVVDSAQAHLWMAQDRNTDACRLLTTTLQTCRVNDVHNMVPSILALLASNMACCGQAAEAIAMLESAIAEQIPKAGGRYNAFNFPKSLAIALGCANRHKEAIDAAAMARAAAASTEERGHETEALLLQAELEAAAGRSREALAHFDEALVMADACGMSFIADRCRAGIQRAAPVVPSSTRTAPSSLPGLRRRDAGGEMPR